jgi:hypothetical protein
MAEGAGMLEANPGAIALVVLFFLVRAFMLLPFGPKGCCWAAACMLFAWNARSSQHPPCINMQLQHHALRWPACTWCARQTAYPRSCPCSTVDPSSQQHNSSHLHLLTWLLPLLLAESCILCAQHPIPMARACCIFCGTTAPSVIGYPQHGCCCCCSCQPSLMGCVSCTAGCHVGF